jgi:SAM-dependent methyltransferase
VTEDKQHECFEGRESTLVGRPAVRNCAVCGCRQKTLIYQQRFVLPSANYVHTGYDVVKCRSCGFAYADVLPNQSCLDSYYGSAAYDAGKLESESEIKRSVHSVNNILSYIGANDTILDIGCGTGTILGLLKRKGFRNLAGLDPSEECSRIAKEKHGVHVNRGGLSDELDIGQFDFVILSHVLEHIQDLRKIVFRLHDFLRPGGRLYIEVPDAYNFLSLADPQTGSGWDFSKDLFAQFCPEHVNFFSCTSLHNLMRRTGFEKVFLESQMSVLGVVASVWAQSPVVPDTLIEERLCKYVEESKSVFKDIVPKIEGIVSKGDEILVWGAGLHTQRLLANTNLANAKICAFIDSNPVFRQQQLAGKPILGPGDLSSQPPLPILISSRRLQDEIEKQIKDMGLKNELILLYPRNPTP